ncbi:MAG: hypothetical protein IPK60_07220 [Sandaracinaceae bacterium]|nr:hypothetical protein [Sandaracinaceae bacterium]
MQRSWPIALMGVLLSLAAPTSAYAWTDASVQTVRAVVDIDRHAVAHVTLVAKVRVHGGWLTDFEVDGLDPDLDLDGQGTPWATDEAGVGYTPAVTRVSEGRVRVSFERRNAPRRGICEIGFHYRTVLAHRATAPSNEGQSIRVRWTLPAWQTGLDGVTLAVSVPGRAEDVYTDDEERDVATVQRTFEHGKTTLTYRRVHLPRTTPWAVEIDTPQAAMDASLGSTRQARAGTHHEELPSWPFRLGLGLLLVLLCVAKERLTVRNYANVRAIVKMPALLRGLFLVAALTSASISDRVNALVPAVSLMAVVLLGLVRSDEPLLERTRLRTHLSLSSLMDLTTLTGALFFAGLCTAAFYASTLHAVQIANAMILLRALPLFAWPLFLTATRLHQTPAASVSTT